MASRASRRARSAGAASPQRVERLLEQRRALAVDVDDRHADAAGAERGARQPLGVAGRLASARAGGERGERLGVARARERVAAREQQVRAAQRSGARVEVERLQRPLELAGRVLVGERVERFRRGLLRQRDRTGRPFEHGRLVRVRRRLGGWAGRRHERVRHRGVEPRAAQAGELVVERLAHERVAERPRRRPSPAGPRARARPPRARRAAGRGANSPSRTAARRLNSRPHTAAVSSTATASSESRSTRRPITSRTLSGTRQRALGAPQRPRAARARRPRRGRAGPPR